MSEREGKAAWLGSISSFASALIALAALLGAAGGTLIGRETVDTEPPETTVRTATVVRTVTVGDGSDESGGPRGSRVGLSMLAEQEDVSEAESFEQVTISSVAYDDAMSIAAYGEGLEAIEVQTKGRFDAISGVVGIHDEADCRGIGAAVEIRDENGQVLWGPRRVDLGPARRFEVSLDRPQRLLFVQAPRGQMPGCNYAYVAWGDVVFAG